MDMTTRPRVFNMLPVRQVTRQCDEWVLYIDRAHLYDALAILKFHHERQFKTLTDIIGVDNLERTGHPNKNLTDRFEVIYVLTSYRYQTRVRLVVSVDEFERLPSVVRLYPAANWFEREVWDMFGVTFEGHPDLRRILTDYGFKGHPMRKDFPLRGFDEVRYDEERKRVVYEELQLRQGYRKFDFRRPWT